MAERTLASPAQLFRRLMAMPLVDALAVIGALLAAVIAPVRRRTRPTLPRMSDRWLQSLDRDTSRHPESWR